MTDEIVDGSGTVPDATTPDVGIIQGISDWFWALPIEHQFIVVGVGCIAGYIILDRLIFHKLSWKGKKRC